MIEQDPEEREAKRQRAFAAQRALLGENAFGPPPEDDTPEAEEE